VSATIPAYCSSTDKSLHSMVSFWLPVTRINERRLLCMAAFVASTIGKHLNFQRTVVHFSLQMSLLESPDFEKARLVMANPVLHAR